VTSLPAASRALMGVAGLLLGIVIALRVATPGEVVGTGTGFFLNFVAAAAFFWALVIWKKLPWQGYNESGSGLALMSTMVATTVLDSALDLRFFDASMTLGSVLLLSAFGAVCLYGWWLAFRRNADARSSKTRPLFNVGVALIVMAIIYAHYWR